ncbi:uncharacterized protein LTR77_000683 [Saxophila tyrrhenica]|uniref:Uncharacterized protein n=1 Tax=Saxophila tyrrhenica TaxID=1690608 RepID=A0AAV9PNP2_9PEZI|nr:hypothetical protein LTR77_000683 [Saxophila tyrrhenica]
MDNITEGGSSTRVGVCNEQPLPLAELPATPVPHPLPVWKGDEPQGLVEGYRHRSHVSERPPSIKPLDFDEAPLINRWSLLANRPKHQPGHAARPSISSPYAFRRIDQTEAQRLSLVPLRLGPVVLRESPVPPELHSPVERPADKTVKHERSESTEDLLPVDGRPQSYRAHRDSPFTRCQQRSSTVGPLPQPPQPAAIATEQRAAVFHEQRATRPSLSSRSSSSSLRRANGGDVSVASSLSSRPSNERMRPKRKRSQQSIRRGGSGNEDQELEKEVMELNTIVEERRAEAARTGTPDQHVAAIAPRMQVRARAETLNDIGSAFSRPITAQSYYRTPMASDTAVERPVLRRSASATLRASSRVSGWLSGIFPSASVSHLPSSEPFYKCQSSPRPLQRSVSHNSICTLTESESPSLTAASSPTTKGHSRSHTGESRVTPLSPAPTLCGYGELDAKKGKEDHWPVVMTPTSQVGLAL